MSGRTGRVAGILSRAAVAALIVTGLGAGVAQAEGRERVEVLRTTAVLANLNTSIPPVVTILQPGRDVAFPPVARPTRTWCGSASGPRTLSRPQDAGWTYAQNLGPHHPLAPC